jgi:hypothetical protein
MKVEFQQNTLLDNLNEQARFRADIVLNNVHCIVTRKDTHTYMDTEIPIQFIFRSKPAFGVASSYHLPYSQ